MSNINNLSTLLHDYIEIFRNIQREQNNALITYLNSQREMNSSLNELLVRYLEIERIRQNNNNRNRNLFSNTFNSTSTPNRFPPIPRIPPAPPIFSFGNNNNNYRSNTSSNAFSNAFSNNRAPLQSPINNNSLNFTSNTSNTDPISGSTGGTQPSLRSLNSFRPRDAPITSFNRRRTNVRRPPRIRATTNVTTTTIPRDVFQNFINNTLNMGNIPQPLNSQDISANITNLRYSDIAETTNQTICPFTQENFNMTDEVSRINPCGHIFTRVHLNRYLRNFDYRCPVCRRDLRRENDVENPAPSSRLLDISTNVLNSNNRNSQQTRNIINNAVESVTNALMNNITNQITNDPSRNAFVAEYSFLLPQFNTSNSTSTADLDIHDYLGIPLPNRTTQTQTTLPPLPEESDNEILDVPEEINDDDL